MDNLKDYILDLTKFAQKQFGFKRPPKMFLKNDKENAKDIFAKTAHYDPQNEGITLYIYGRHPKDVLRSLAHELVHHTQKLRGDLSPDKCGDLGPGYAQENEYMREMEREAYERGSLCFRDYEDKCKKSLEENANKTLKENKEMSSKLTKEALKSVITRFLNESQVEETQTTPESTDEDAMEESTCNTRDKENELEEELEQEGVGKVVHGVVQGASKLASKLVAKKPVKYTTKGAAKIASGQSTSKGPSEAKFIHEQEMIDEVEGLSEQEKADLEEIIGNAAKKAISNKATNAAKGKAKSVLQKAKEKMRTKNKAKSEKSSENPITEGTCGTCNESKENCVCPTNEAINTPEKENALYESRFNKRNELLFEKLMSKF